MHSTKLIMCVHHIFCFMHDRRIIFRILIFDDFNQNTNELVSSITLIFILMIFFCVWIFNYVPCVDGAYLFNHSEEHTGFLFFFCFAWLLASLLQLKHLIPRPPPSLLPTVFVFDRQSANLWPVFHSCDMYLWPFLLRSEQFFLWPCC